VDTTNNTEELDAVANQFAIGIGKGTFAPTVKLEAYFSDLTLRNKFVANTWSSVAFILDGQDGGTYVVEFPRCRIVQGEKTDGGKNSRVMQNMTYEAVRHPTGGHTVNVARFIK
jgi:hypothetical protein